VKTGTVLPDILDLKNTTQTDSSTLVAIIHCLLASVIKNRSIIIAADELPLHYTQYYLHQTWLQWTDQTKAAAQYTAVERLVSA
jgi:hypothetical protein